MTIKNFISKSLLVYSATSMGFTIPTELTIKNDDLEKLEFILNNSKLAPEETFFKNLNNGTIRLNESGLITVEKSRYELLLDLNLINNENSVTASLCAKTH